MNKCLYCGLKTQPSEVYDGIQLYECEAKHRTGIIEEQEFQDEKKDLKIA